MLRIGGFSLLLLLLPLAGAAQLSYSLESLSFPPTTIDSTRVMSVTLSNDLAIDQTVQFNSVSPPFTLGIETLFVPAGGNTDLSISFSPISVNDFGMELIATGSAFGVDTLLVSAEGSLPEAILLADTLDFESVSVNSYATEYLPMASVGIGSLYVDSIVSSNPVIFAEQGVAIAQGDTAQIPITFYSEFSGIYEVDLTIYTSDPFESVRYAHCTISAISEVGGEVCGTWSLVNSPYLLVDNVVVPDNCSLTIEPGVVILGDSLDIEVFGALYANGTAELPINMTVGELLSHTTAENMVLTYSSVSESSSSPWYDVDYRLIRDGNIYESDSLAFFLDSYNYDFISFNENSASHIGKYSEDWSDGIGQGWTVDGNINSYDQQDYLRLYYNNCCSNWEHNAYSPTFTANPGETFTQVSFRVRTDWYYNCDYEYEHFISIDGGPFSEMHNSNCEFTDFQHFTYDLSTIAENAQTVRFRFRNSFYRFGDLRLDDFVLITSAYPGDDIPLDEASTAAATAAANGNIVLASSAIESMSTGGIQLLNSSFLGDFHSLNDSIVVVVENSSIVGNDFRLKDSHGMGLYADHVDITTINSNIAQHPLDGLQAQSTTTNWFSNQSTIEANNQDGADINGNLNWESGFDLIESNGSHGLVVSGDVIWNSIQDVISGNGSEGLTVAGTLALDADSTFVTGNGSHGIEALGSNSDVTLYQSQLKDNGGDGIRLIGSVSDLEADYSFVRDNGGDAVEMGSSGTLRMDNCLLGYNNGYGINSYGAVDLNYMNILHNGGYGIRTSQFSTVDNSIIWFNGGVPQMITDNTYAVSYTNVQGINALLTSTDFAWGNGCIGTDPVLADDQGHLDPYSPCVDGGMPWEQDAHIPYGLGSSRADMGMYGGPANEYWGGQAPPDGAVQITDVFDIPQDQGGFVGMHFTASPFDFGGLGFNVTHYSIWRDLALGSDTPADVSAGNWEQIGEVPAQGFNQYGYTAATLMDAYPGETACLTSFIVIAHTTDDNIYWVSDVAAACSEDNLAPAIPDLGGMVLADADDEAIALLSWALPEEEDYAYTVVTGDNGFNGTVTDGDTLVTDPSLEPGAIVAYEAVHFDIHGNASDIAALVLEAPLGEDLIPLRAGWNLVSSDRIPDALDLESLVADLTPGNLQYVIAFDAGVQFYDPDGLSFLNTLSSWNAGYGHWLKVDSDDTLRVTGGRLAEDHMPGLAEGWNLVGYAAEDPATPDVVFEDLVASGDLLYVTGFDQGVEIYDPNGLPFLNTLDAMRNGFGYWVKSAVATDGDVLAPLTGDVLPAEMPAPRYDVLNGTSGLLDAAGEFVDVLNAAGTVVARMPILDGGYLMTTALFGDDPATAAVEGLTAGEAVRFAFRGAVAHETVEFGGDMAHRTLALTFGEADAALAVFPNPATEETTIRFGLSQMADVLVTMRDVQGREVMAVTHAGLLAGEHALPLALESLQAGTYTLEVKACGVALGSTRVVVME